MKTQTFDPGPWSQGSRPRSPAPRAGGREQGRKVPPPPLASGACPLPAVVPASLTPHSVLPVPGQQQVGPSGPSGQLVLAGGGEADGQRRVQTPLLESAFRNDVSGSQVSNTKRHRVFMFIKRA